MVSSLSCMCLPAQDTSRVGTHTSFVFIAWEWSMHRQLSRWSSCHSEHSAAAWLCLTKQTRLVLLAVWDCGVSDRGGCSWSWLRSSRRLRPSLNPHRPAPALSLGIGKPVPWLLPPRVRAKARCWGLSSSEEVDVLSIEVGGFEDSPPLSPSYEELLEAATCAVAKLNI